ncbi:putative Ras GTPase-activating protein-binding protein [Helianthus anomalus]
MYSLFCTGMHAINAKILSLNYGDFKAEIKSVDAQESLNGGVSVLVTGYMTGMDNIQQQFTQSFFLVLVTGYMTGMDNISNMFYLIFFFR